MRADEEQLAIENRANKDASIAVVAGNHPISVIGRPVSITTNVQGQSITLVLPIIVDRFSTFAVVKVTGWNDNVEANISKYVQGYADGSFRPDQFVKRVEVAAMMARLVDEKLTNTTDQFADIPDHHWGLPFVRLMVQLNVMKGYGDGSFKPDQAMTRAEMAVVLLSLMDIDKVDHASTTFTDMLGHWAGDAVAQLYSKGIIEGYGDGTFRPDRPLTRAEAITIINRVYGIQPVENVQPSWNDVDVDHWAYEAIQAVSE